MNGGAPETPETPKSSPPGGWMIAFGWALILLIAVLIFNGFLEDRQNPNRLSVLQNQNDGRLSLRANHNGQYFAEGRINGVAVNFLLDTGATTVAVPPRVAERAGLRGGAHLQVETAAGTAAAQSTRIRRLELGHLVFSDLQAVIIPGGENTVLLGMNALGELKMTQEDGKLILEKPGG